MPSGSPTLLLGSLTLIPALRGRDQTDRCSLDGTAPEQSIWTSIRHQSPSLALFLHLQELFEGPRSALWSCVVPGSRLYLFLLRKDDNSGVLWATEGFPDYWLYSVAWSNTPVNPSVQARVTSRHSSKGVQNRSLLTWGKSSDDDVWCFAVAVCPPRPSLANLSWRAMTVGPDRSGMKFVRHDTFLSPTDRYTPIDYIVTFFYPHLHIGSTSTYSGPSSSSEVTPRSRIPSSISACMISTALTAPAVPQAD